MAWLAANGVVLDGVTLGVSPLQGLGVIATRNLGVGDAAILVPRAAQLFAESEALHPASRRLAEKAAARLGASSSPSVAAKFEEGALAAALVSEASLLRGGARKWEPGGADGKSDEGAPSHYAAYLESLQRLSEMPRPAWSWGQDRLEREASAQLAADARELRLQIDTEYRELAEDGAAALASGEALTEHQWHWARAQVMSRTFDVSAGLALVPGMDCANHDSDALFEVFVDEEGDLGIGECSAVLLVDRDVAKGEEVFISYGEKSNDDLLLHYGFRLGGAHNT